MDRDEQDAQARVSQRPDLLSEGVATPVPLNLFPRGARAGELIHSVLEKIEETVLPETTVEGQAPSSVTEEPTLFEAIDVTEPQPERIIAEAETTEAGQAPQQGEAVSEAIPVVEEEVTSLDELFALQPEILDVEDDEEEDTDENDKDRKNKKKGKKKKFVEVEYDPERDVTLVRKKHKRGSDWEETW